MENLETGALLWKVCVILDRAHGLASKEGKESIAEALAILANIPCEKPKPEEIKFYRNGNDPS